VRAQHCQRIGINGRAVVLHGRRRLHVAATQERTRQVNILLLDGADAVAAKIGQCGSGTTVAGNAAALGSASPVEQTEAGRYWQPIA
jgi:hypothetical protein